MNDQTRVGQTIETSSKALSATLVELARQCRHVRESWWIERMELALEYSNANQVHEEWIGIVLAGYAISYMLPREEHNPLKQHLLAIASDIWVKEARELHAIEEPELDAQARTMLRERATEEHVRNQDPGAGIAFAIACDAEHRHEAGRYLVIAIREYCESEYERDELGKDRRVKHRKKIEHGERAVGYLADSLLKVAERHIRESG